MTEPTYTSCKKNAQIQFTGLYHLQFLLGGSLVGLDGLEHTEAGLLDVGNSLVLLLGQLLVGRLQLLHLGLKVGLGILELLLLGSDLGIEVSIGHGLRVLNGLLLGGVAKVEVGRATGWSEVLVGELLQVFIGAATLVVLEVVDVSVLDGGVSLDAVLAAQVLVNRAVDVVNSGGLRILEFLHELVPSRLHGFAVASPRGLEFDENTLAGGFRIKVVGSERKRAGRSHNRGQKEDSP